VCCRCLVVIVELLLVDSILFCSLVGWIVGCVSRYGIVYM
jgi:hypothetical protein